MANKPLSKQNEEALREAVRLLAEAIESVELKHIQYKFDEDQPRDENGRFASTGGGGGSSGESTSQSSTPSSYGGYELSEVENPKDEKNEFSVESQQLANERREVSGIKEPVLTKSMIDTAERTGMKMNGLNYRIKSEKSLSRKIDEEAKLQGIPKKDAADDMKDIVRYTMTAKDDEYVDKTNATIDELRKEGYDVRAKNYWQTGDPYQGINAVVTDKDGYVFELQFHTETSAIVKNDVHAIYEVYRINKDNETRWTQYGTMVDISNERIPVPPPPDKLLAIGERRFQAFTTAEGTEITYVPGTTFPAQSNNEGGI